MTAPTHEERLRAFLSIWARVPRVPSNRRNTVVQRLVWPADKGTLTRTPGKA